MEQAARELAFEKAALYRDQIRGLSRTLEHQAIVAEHHLDQDIFGIHRQDASVGIALLFVRSGMITGAQIFFLADPLGEDENLLAQTILQYYTAERQPPRELLLPFAIEDQELIAERLAELREGPVTLLAPQRGKRMQLMQMADANAAQIFSEQAKQKRILGDPGSDPPGQAAAGAPTRTPSNASTSPTSSANRRSAPWSVLFAAKSRSNNSAITG